MRWFLTLLTVGCVLFVILLFILEAIAKKQKRKGKDNEQIEEEHEREMERVTEVEGIDPMGVLTKPHTVIALVISMALLVYFAFTRDESYSTISNVKAGILAACLIFLLFAMLQMRDGLFIRPHPAFWRVVMGVSVLYLIGLVWLLFQSVDDARKLLSYWDPELGKPLPERSYAEHCDLYTPYDNTSNFRNLMDTLNDEFIIAHTLGWWGQTLLWRDVGLCFFLSVLFEVWELTFQHMLPNFAECWWDHIILDVLLCNTFGIWIGHITCKHLLKMKQYDWGGLRKSSARPAKLVRPFSIFSPFSYQEYRWEVFSNWRRLLQVAFLIITISVIQLNAFFLKYELWVPPPHHLNVARLVLWFFMGMPAIREFYSYVTDPNCKKFGAMAWLACAVATTELLVIIKFGRGMYPKPMPPEVKWSWITFLVLFIGGAFIYFYRKEKRKKGTSSSTKQPKQKTTKAQ